MFSAYGPGMEEASPEDVAQAIAFALQYDGRKRNHQADNLMARIVAERLVRHLQQSGFVLMKRPAAEAPSAPAPYR
jgi:hypothetical protein